MRPNIFPKTSVLLLALLFCVQAAVAGNNRKAGIGFRGSHWKMSNNPATVHVSSDPTQTNVDVGSGGGYLYFFSRVSDASWMEFSLGAVGEVQAHSEYFFGEETRATAVTPVLLGFRHDLFGYDTQSSLIPYLSFGAGPYWFNDIYTKTEYYGYQDEVEIRTKAKIGGYAGGGVNFMMADWFGINFDARHHFINFDVKNPDSGWEFGLGVLFAWGKYKQPVYRSIRHHHHRRGDDVHIYID